MASGTKPLNKKSQDRACAWGPTHRSVIKKESKACHKNVKNHFVWGPFYRGHTLLKMRQKSALATNHSGNIQI